MLVSVEFLNTFEGCSFRVECFWKHGSGSGKGLLPTGPALPYYLDKEQGFGVGYFRNEPENELTGFGNPNNAETS